MMLLVDLGNTCIKWALSDGTMWRTDRSVHANRRLEDVLDNAWGSLAAPARIVACSVAAVDRWQSLIGWCTTHWQQTPHRVEAAAQFADVRNAYREPTKLGADRWAALIAARQLVTGEACVVDCGTAVTIDRLGKGGEHRGGVIFPGLALLRASLRFGTGGIRDSDGDASSCLARSTADGVAAGTAFGLVGAIERVLNEYEHNLTDGELSVLMTGGDAEYVAASLKRKTQYQADLVLRGLKRIADTLC